MFYSTPILVVTMFKQTDNTRSQQISIYISLMVTKLVMRSRTPEHWKQSREKHNTTKSHHVQSGIGYRVQMYIEIASNVK